MQLQHTSITFRAISFVTSTAFLKASLALSFSPCLQRANPLLADSSRFLLIRKYSKRDSIYQTLHEFSETKHCFVFKFSHLPLGTYSLVGWLLIRLKERETAAKAEIDKQGDRESQCHKQGEWAYGKPGNPESGNGTGIRNPEPEPEPEPEQMNDSSWEV